MKYTIIDIETDGLLPDVSLVHCLSYQIYEGKKLLSKGSITDYDQISKFILNQELVVCHNVIRYDIPALEKVFKALIKVKVIDTLAVSFALYPIPNFKHSLAYWGERMGFGKPVVEDWKSQPLEVYIHRCESDVEINARTFHHMMDYLMEIYSGNLGQVKRLFGYLNYKFYCLKDQEEEGITLDTRLAEKCKLDLEFTIDQKVTNLAKNMPRVVTKTAPKNMYKQNGELSAHGARWKQTLKNLGLPETATEITEPGNPGSPSQLKDWLLQLGWKPKTFKVSKNTGEKLPQVSLPFGAGLCPSVKDMFGTHPFLEELGGLYKARHRYGLFKSFLENKDSNDRIYSSAHGLTNTFRLQHSKPVVNLPGVGKYYGEEIRGCLKVPNDDYIMCGSDISGLEDNTKQHYIYFYDPDYVNEMRVPGFDPHIDIAVLADLISKEDETFYKEIEKAKDEDENYKFETEEDANRYYNIKKKRGEAKVINFSATYGAGPPKIAATLKCSLAEATKLHTTYWSRNSAVKKTAKACKVKTVKGQKWLYNPVSGFWMFLKADKDKFSTLNQSTGVYVFDSWVRKCREKLLSIGVKIIMQYHDELLLVCKKSQKQEVEKILKTSMAETNEEVKLNVEIGISVDWGTNYAECH